MVFFKYKKGKKGCTYYIIYNQKIRVPDGSITCKKKWLKVGKTKTEAKQALRHLKKNNERSQSNLFLKNRYVYKHLLIKNFYLGVKLEKHTKNIVEPTTQCY